MAGSVSDASDAVAVYLDELRGALRVSIWRRRRIIAEVTDHVTELIGDERARGGDSAAAVKRAVERLGAPTALAAEFNADAARHRINRASRGVGVCAAAAFVAAGLSLHPGATARPWPDGPVFSLVMQLWIQVPVVCAVIGLFLAVVAPWLRGTPLHGRPAKLAGRNLALASLLLVPVAAAAAANLGAGMPLAQRLPLAIVAVATPIAAIRGLRAAAAAPSLANRSDEQEDVLDVIAAVGVALARRSALAGRAYQCAGQAWRALGARAPQVTRWLDLRHHPWRAAASTSVAAGLVLTAPDLLRGDPDFLAAAVQAVVVYLCFATLGRPLGLRGKRPPDMRPGLNTAATT